MLNLAKKKGKERLILCQKQMKNGLNKVKDAGIKARALVCSGILAIQTGLMNAVILNAGDPGEVENSKATDILQTIAGVIVNAIALMGGIFVLIGAYKIIMAFKDNQPEQQATGIREVVIGAILISFRLFVWNSIKGVIF